MRVLAWIVGFFAAGTLLVGEANKGHFGRAGIILLVMLAVLGPAFFRAKQRAFERGLGQKRANDAMRRD